MIGGVRGSDNPVVLPRNDEEDRLLGTQEQPHFRVDLFFGDHQMNAL